MKEINDLRVYVRSNLWSSLCFDPAIYSNPQPVSVAAFSLTLGANLSFSIDNMLYRSLEASLYRSLLSNI